MGFFDFTQCNKIKNHCIGSTAGRRLPIIQYPLLCASKQRKQAAFDLDATGENAGNNACVSKLSTRAEPAHSMASKGELDRHSMLCRRPRPFSSVAKSGMKSSMGFFQNGNF